MGSVPLYASLEEELDRSLTRHRPALRNVSSEIHDHPELAYEETHAHDTLCDTLESLGYKVTRHAYGLETAFEAQSGHDGALVVYNAEYDALPGIGHACGHNLIATSSLAAFLATADALKENGIEGRVRLLGTPAEEGGGGKIALIEAGAYKDADACLMGHPGPLLGTKVGLIFPSSLARAGAKVTFHGVNAHAGLAPWLGKNALDAAVGAYNNLSMLRQQIEPDQRIHAIISKGGDRPNIIPHLTEMLVSVRAPSNAQLQDTYPRVIACFEGAATAAGCTVDIVKDTTYKELNCNRAIAKRFQRMAGHQGEDYEFAFPKVGGASTDQGNVSYELPSLHPGFGIPVGRPEVGPHHPDFAAAAGTDDAFDSALRFGKVMAATGLEILQDKQLREEMWAEYKETFGKDS